MESGVARVPIKDWNQYVQELKARLGLDNELLRNITSKAQSSPKKVVFAEADNVKILKAAQVSYEEGVAFPILLGDRQIILDLMNEYNIELPEVTIIDPKEEAEAERLRVEQELE